MLGNVVQFRLDVQGYSSKVLWVEWTMYQMQAGEWQPSRDVSLDDCLEAYVVPSVPDDQGIITFWVPLPTKPGVYRVQYSIVAPDGQGASLDTAHTDTFH